jgi:glycosyltransferase involved in cell wall biosynthesis
MNETQEPFVSICCITYNQEKYIKDAIEGFLTQKTEFPFEIIIHDDASTDMTADIIREYEKKYPEKITAIYQIENQFSKGVMPEILPFKASKGKYIAFCEGDDYWTDSSKLQKQITEMEKNPESHISFHPAIVKFDDGSKGNTIIGLHSKENKIFTIEEVILGGGAFMPSASIVINKSVLPRISSFFGLAKPFQVGDYFLQILGAENGGALYLSEIMCVYRKNATGSFSERLKKDSQLLSLIKSSCIETLEKMDAFTNYKYTKLITIQKRKAVSEIIISLQYDSKTKENIFSLYSNEISKKDKLLWNAIFKHPKAVKILKKIMKLVRGF